jgi:hypothetical protein
MLRLREGKADEAWADILACHRLGRLVGRGATLIEGLVGVAICQIAANATLAYLDSADLTAGQARACAKDLRSLPAFAPTAEKIEVMERMAGLDALQMVRRGGPAALANLLDDSSFVVPDQKALDAVDWATVMQTMNGGYDRLVVAMKVRDRAARAKAFEKVEADFLAAKKEVADEKKLKKLSDAKDGKAIGKAFGGLLMSLLSPALQKVQLAHERGEQVAANLQVAFALAAYKADKGNYPAKLADLAPKYLQEVPGDLFSGKALIYKPSGKGYLLYSVGANGKDDGGKTYGDEEPGDDLPVKMPLPELKKKP